MPLVWCREAREHAQQRGLAAAGGAEQRVELAGTNGQRHVPHRPRVAVALPHLLHAHFRQADHRLARPHAARSLAAPRAPVSPARSGTTVRPRAARITYTAPGGIQASRVVARTGPRKAAAILDALTMPIAVPEARWAIPATERGNTGEMQSTCRKRTAPKLHAPGASARAASPSDEATRNHTMVRRSPTISPRRGAMKEPSAAAAPVAKSRRPPTSSIMGGLTPRRGRTWGSMAVRKKIWMEPDSTKRHTVVTSRTDAVGGRSCSGRADGW